MGLTIQGKLEKQINDIAEVASYIWQRGWGERNGGNISVNITEVIGDENRHFPALRTVSLLRPLPLIANNIFFVSGTGCRMRNIARNPLENACIIRINDTGNQYDIIGEHDIPPTSELPSHLCIHAWFVESNPSHKVVLHTHATELIGLSHIEKFNNNAELINKVLWSMIPETFVFVPRGLGWVPYRLPGSLDLADYTTEVLSRHDFILWEKHGILGVGEDIVEVFDLIDTLTKSAKIYEYVRSCGYEPIGLSDAEIDGLRKAFNL